MVESEASQSHHGLAGILGTCSMFNTHLLTSFINDASHLTLRTIKIRQGGLECTYVTLFLFCARLSRQLTFVVLSHISFKKSLTCPRNPTQSGRSWAQLTFLSHELHSGSHRARVIFLSRNPLLHAVLGYVFRFSIVIRW